MDVKKLEKQEAKLRVSILRIILLSDADYIFLFFRLRSKRELNAICMRVRSFWSRSANRCGFMVFQLTLSNLSFSNHTKMYS